MKQDQKLSPKYWVIHDKTSDDILFWTMHKSKQGSISEYNLNYETPVEDDEDLECILIEIKEVNL